MTNQLASELEVNHKLRIQLNPIRCWSVFETNILLDDDAVPPADVLFYPVGNEVRTAVLEPDGKLRIDELANLGACTIDEWIASATLHGCSDVPSRSSLLELCRDLSEMGLLAFS